MKPRRKLTAIVMAAAMMLTMVPAAYAAESPNVEEPMYVWAHGEQVKVPDQSDVQAALESEPGTNAIDLQSTSNNVYHISSAAELMTIPQSVWISGNTFELDANIDLSSVTPPAEWGGYINFFKGTLDGNGHTISGLENNTYLIYGMIGGTIKDVNLALSGTDAAALAFISASDGQTPIEIRFEDVTTSGSVTLTTSDQSNYSPFIYASGKGGFSMIDCINNAEITSNTYGAIFYGYHPLYYKDDNGNAVEFLFDGCVNNADVSMGYASMFFGNPTGMEEAVANNEFDLTITNCDNNKNINGINSSHYLVPSINSTTLTTELAGLESEIQSNSSNKLDPQKLTTGGTLEGFTYSIDSDKKIDVTAPTDDENVSYYVVSVGSYFHLYSNDANAPRPYNGTEQYVVTETIMAENLNAGVSLKYYGIADANYGSAGTGIFCQISPDYEYETYATRTNNDQTYYELPLLRNGALIDGFYRCYAQVNPTTKEPVTGYANPAFINVTAYDDNGNVLGFAKEVDPA